MPPDLACCNSHPVCHAGPVLHGVKLRDSGQGFRVSESALRPQLGPAIPAPHTISHRECRASTTRSRSPSCDVKMPPDITWDGLEPPIMQRDNKRPHGTAVAVHAGPASPRAQGDLPFAELPPATNRLYRVLILVCFFTIVISATVVLAVLASLGMLGGAGNGQDFAATLSSLPATNTSAYMPYYQGTMHVYLSKTEMDAMDIAVDYDVIVIGAGLAGLAAANSLQEAGLAVLVVEASVREEFGGADFDLENCFTKTTLAYRSASGACAWPIPGRGGWAAGFRDAHGWGGRGERQSGRAVHLWRCRQSLHQPRNQSGNEAVHV